MKIDQAVLRDDFVEDVPFPGTGHEGTQLRRDAECHDQLPSEGADADQHHHDREKVQAELGQAENDQGSNSCGAEQDKESGGRPDGNVHATIFVA